jgi:hypothetical protein
MDERAVCEWSLHYYPGPSDNDDRHRFSSLSGSRRGNARRRAQGRRTGFVLAYPGAEHRPICSGVGSLLAVSAIDSQRLGKAASC